MEPDQALTPSDADQPAAELAPTIEAQVQAWQQENRERYQQLQRDARSAFRAMEGWRALEGEDAWRDTWLTARQEYRSGRFLLERLGAERFLDPTLMATLWSLRQEMIEDLGAEGTHELMLVDIAVMSYYHMLRFNNLIGDLALQVEAEFFGQESPTATFKRQYGHGAVTGLRVEDSLQRIGEQLLPLMDRSQRMFVRALRELRRPQAPSVAIAQAGQVNVGTVQQNTAQIAEPGGAPRTARRRGRAPSAAVEAIPGTDAATQPAMRKRGTRGTRREGTQR